MGEQMGVSGKRDEKEKKKENNNNINNKIK